MMLAVVTAFLAAGVFLSAAAAQPPSSGNGAKRFDDLRELNNKLSRAISRLEGELPKLGSVIKDPGHWTRTLNDLEVTKLRAVDQFPPVFGMPYGKTFRELSCIDNEIAVSKQIMILLEGPSGTHLPGNGSWLTSRGTHYVSRVVLNAVKNAKDCKDVLEVELSGASLPTGISDDLRELNNKLSRAISRLHGELPKLGSVIKDPGHWTRTLNDLEVTKLRAVDQFPEILDPPYGETFRQLSCIDNEIAVSKQIMILLEGPSGTHLPGNGSWLTSRGTHYVSRVVLNAVKNAKDCKDVLEVDLLHSFNLKPSEQTEVGVNATTPNGTDTRNPKKLNAPKALEHAYKRDGFVGRHEQDYVAMGISSSNPDSWPTGRNVLFFDVFDLFGSTRGAQKANQASQQNLKSSGFTPIQDSSLSPGESAFQHQAPGSSVLSTIIYVQRGTFIMKIAGACNGCSKGSIESSLKSVAEVQLNRAVLMGFPGPAPSFGSGGGGGPQPTASGSLSNGSGSALAYSVQTNTTANAFELILPTGTSITGTSTPSGFSCSNNGNTEVCTGGSVQPNTPVTGTFDHTGTFAANCGCVQLAFSRDGGMTWFPNPPVTFTGPPASSPPASASCSGHAILGNIYGGQAHQVVADFTCPKASTEFSLTVPSGYQITGGQATNSASSGYSCTLNSTMDTVDCIGTAPAGSTTYVQFTTSPNPQAGMNLALKVSFSDGSTTSFTLITQ